MYYFKFSNNINFSKSRKHFGRAVKFVSTVITNGCNGCIKYLEHVQLCVTIQYPKRGMMEIDLQSPKSKYTYQRL